MSCSGVVMKSLYNFLSEVVSIRDEDSSLVSKYSSTIGPIRELRPELGGNFSIQGPAVPEALVGLFQRNV